MSTQKFLTTLLCWAVPLFLLAQAPSTEGLIAYWKFDETSGTTAADLAGGHHATLSSGTSFAPDQGQSAGALQLDGNQTAVTVPAFDIGANAATFAAWIWPAPPGQGASTSAPIIQKASSTTEYFTLSLGTPSSIQLRLWLDGGSTTFSGPSQLLSEDRVWHHVAYTYNGSQVKLYHNGLLVKTFNAPGTLAAGPGVEVTIGNESPTVGTDRPYQGKIDELRIYNRALNDSEVAALTSVEAYRQLPVTFAGFRAKPTISGVVLDWTVEDQYNNAGFAVERAVDGQRDFMEVGFVPAHARGDYHYADLSAPAGRSLYYRLRQVDHDGSEMYSELVKVNSGGGPEIRVFPNPASVSMKIAGSGYYVVLDAYGRRVMEGQAVSGSDIAVAGLPPGTYTVIMDQYRARFVKL